MNNKFKIAAAAMVPLVNGQSLFEQKTESLKADLERMILNLEGPVIRVDKSGLFVREWCHDSTGHVSFADVDGDGIPDMICDSKFGKHWVLLLDGKGGFKKNLGMFQTGWCGHEGARTHWADINGDGRADMLCSDENGKHWAKLTALGGPSFGLNAPGNWLQDLGVIDDKYCKGGNFKYVDMNGNKKADMVCDYPGSGSHWSQYSVGDGNFLNMGALEKRFCHKDDVVNYADLDGDGNMDIICSHDNGEHHPVFLDGQGNIIQDGHVDEITMGFCVGHPDKVQFADVNGDGKEDMVCDIGGNHWAKLSYGNGKFADFMSWQGAWCAQDSATVTWVDITGDGRAEMICSVGKTGNHWVQSLNDWFKQTK